jgi:PIN domain nuclease of toxin-antitoxin system
VRLLLDTHVFLWIRREPKRIPARVEQLVKDPANSVLVSAATAWEIAIKVGTRKLDFDKDFLAAFDDRIRELAWEPLFITAAHGAAAGALAGRHKDPFDRILAGQAKCEGLTLVSADPAFKALGVDAMW